MITAGNERERERLIQCHKLRELLYLARFYGKEQFSWSLLIVITYNGSGYGIIIVLQYGRLNVTSELCT